MLFSESVSIGKLYKYKGKFRYVSIGWVGCPGASEALFRGPHFHCFVWKDRVSFLRDDSRHAGSDFQIPPPHRPRLRVPSPRPVGTVFLFYFVSN